MGYAVGFCVRKLRIRDGIAVGEVGKQKVLVGGY